MFDWDKYQSEDVNPLDFSWFHIMFRFNRTGIRIIRRVAAHLASRPGIAVDLTIGRGLRRRNGRIRLTGPAYAMGPATAWVRTELARHHLLNPED